LAALVTRTPKPSNDDVGGTVDLRTLWRSQALAVGIDPDDEIATVGRPRAVDISERAASRLSERLVGVEGLTAQESVFERRDLIRVLAEPGVVQLEGVGRGGEQLQTTRELLDVEAALLEMPPPA